MNPAVPTPLLWQAVERLDLSRIRRMAAALLRKERPDHTLQVTALVNEALCRVRMVLFDQLSEEHRYSMAARAMRQTLIDYSRRARLRQRIPLDDISGQLDDPRARTSESRLNAKHAFDQLMARDPQAARALWLREVEGCSVQETAQLMGLPHWVVKQFHKFALQWMKDYLA